MHSKQGWRTETEDGDIREVRATRTPSGWRFKSRRKGDPEWTRHDPPLVHDVQALCDLLERKYRRRRASLKAVDDVRKLLQSLEA